MSGGQAVKRQLRLELPNGRHPVCQGNGPMLDASEPRAAANPGLSAAVDPMEVFRYLRAPGLAVSAGLPEISYGPALLLRFWLRHSPAKDWQTGGRPVVFTTMREAAAHLNVTEPTARRYARWLRDAGAWTPVNPLASGPAQGVDLSPLAEFIPKLRAIAGRQRALRAERAELKRKYHAARREAVARINRMHRAGLLTEYEANKLHNRIGERFRLQTRPSLSALAWHIDDLNRLLARLEPVDAELSRIQRGLHIAGASAPGLEPPSLSRHRSDRLSRKENPHA